MAIPFMTDAEFDDLKPLIDDGMATLQEWNDPPSIQLRRRAEASGNFADAGPPFTPIAIRDAQRMERVAGENTGRITVVNGGELWVRPAQDIRRDDRFTIDGVTHVVTRVLPADRVKQVARFERLGG